MSEIFQKIYDCLNGKFPDTIKELNKKAFISSYNIQNFNKDVPKEKRSINYNFELDKFQKQAVYHITKNENVFIAAHTSSGKTLAAEYAIADSLKSGNNVVYTSPIKALSNQKYRDFKEKFNTSEFNFNNEEDNVGIITGDIQVNPTAKCLVMTTEILRSMIYKNSDYLMDIKWIIFDEIHYMNDNERGRIWEEIIQMAGKHISMIFLSATTPNSLQFSNWVANIRNKPVYVCQTNKRPIPIEHYINIGTNEQVINGYYNEIVETEKIEKTIKTKQFSEESKDGKNKNIVTNEIKEFVKINKKFQLQEDIDKNLVQSDRCYLIKDKDEQFLKSNVEKAKEQLNNKLTRKVKNKNKKKKNVDEFNKHISYKSKIAMLTNLFKLLEIKDKLPAIVFAFSRKGCENYCNELKSIDFLKNKKDKYFVKTFIKDCLLMLSEVDRNLDQIIYVSELLMRGIGIHHSGLLPILKEMVEILFQNGYLKILFATETFAMGVNMPARTVIFSGLKKHDGKSFRNLLPGEYTQMAGRAGRRGFDKVGTVIILTWQSIPDLNRILVGKPLTLESQYRLTYQTILSILQLSQNDDNFSISNMLRGSFGEHNINFNLNEINYSSKTLQEAKGIYGRLVKLSQLERKNIKKLDDFYESMENIIPFMEKVHENTLTTLFAGKKKRNKFLSNKRIILVTPEAHNLYPALMIVIDYNDVNMQCIYLDDYLNNKDHEESSNIFIKTVDIEYNWIVGITTTCLDDYKSIEKLNLIGKKQLLISKKEDGVSYNNNKLKFDSLFKNSYNIGFEINELEFKLSKQRVKLRYLIQDLHYSISDKTLQLMPDYEKKIKVLKKLNYINEDSMLLLKGKVCKEINTCNELMLTECIMDGLFQHLPLPILTALISLFVVQTRSKTVPTISDISKIDELLADKIEYIEKDILNLIIKTQENVGLPIDSYDFKHKNFNLSMIIVVYYWCKGKNFSEICKVTDIMEGTIVRIMLRLIETLLEIKKIAEIIGNNNLEKQMEECILLVKRDIVYTESLYI